MATVTLRQSSGNTESRLDNIYISPVPLTNSDLDNNFNGLNNDIDRRIFSANAEMVTANVSDSLIVSGLSTVSDFTTNTISLNSISSTLHKSSGSITSVFVYDTRKDSDGGSWVNKCKCTSWYNETLSGKWLGAFASEAAARTGGGTTNDYFQRTSDGKFYSLNASSGITEVFRGNKRDFPRIAGIVCESNSVTIYDLTEANNPMWMRFNSTITYGVLNYPSTTSTIRQVFAVNGNLYVTKSHSTNGNGSLVKINFIKDKAFQYGCSTLSSICRGTYLSRLSERNSTVQYNGVDYLIPTSTTWNPTNVTGFIDPKSNKMFNEELPEPTIVVTGIASGVFVINGSNYSYWNLTSYSLSNDINTTSPIINSNYLLVSANGEWFYSPNPYALTTGFVPTRITTSNGFEWARSIISDATSKDRSNILTANSNILFNHIINETDLSKGLTTKITKDYNTGWTCGDIKRVYLANTISGNVTSTLVDVSYKSVSANIVGTLVTTNVEENCSLVGYSGFS